MIAPRHKWLNCWILNTYINFIIRKDFRQVLVTGDVTPDERSVLLIPNHFSWWDGFFAWYLNQRLLKKKFHIMMLEHELSKRMFFSKVGAFSVKLSSRDILNSLDFCTSILSSPKNMLVMFPQGKLFSQHSYKVKFQKGVERIIMNAPNSRVILAACLVDYYSHRKPSLTISLTEYKGKATAMELEAAFNHHLKNSLANQEVIYKG